MQRVYDAWRAHHPTSPKTPKAKGGPAGAIRGRLSEGYEPAQLIEAIEHNHNDEWASSIGKHELTYVLRSAETTTRWLEWRPPTRTPTANERGLANLFEMAKGVRR